MELDPRYGLCVTRTDLVTRHSARASLEYARRLLAQGEAESTQQALGIIRRAMDSQVLEVGHPHRGGFRFFDEDEEVTGLNVASFVLQQLLGIWTEQYDRLPSDLRSLIRERVTLALEELERLHVHPRYTNPALMDVANALLWGEILGDAHAVATGTARLEDWIAFTARAGAPYEYNSPGYLAIDLQMLALLAGRARDAAVRLKAQLMAERIWLHALLHYHAPTGRLAGPHSRAYQAAMHGAPDGVLALFRRELGLEAVATGSPYLRPAAAGAGRRQPDTPRCPPSLAAWPAAQATLFPYMVRETAHRPPAEPARDRPAEPAPAPGTGLETYRAAVDASLGTVDLATYCTASYALGTASRTYTIGQTGYDIDHQANHCILYYRYGPSDRSDGQDEWRTLYTRFVVNDRYLGSIEQHALRTRRTNFYDQGLFAGHQQRNVAIALYGLELQDQGLSSVEALVVMPGPVRPDAIYAGIAGQGQAGQRRIQWRDDAPVPLPEDGWIVIEDGAVWIGVWPLARDQLGNRRPLELRRLPTGELALALPHYRGQEKWFWEYASPRAAFYRRNIRSGVLLVVGERAHYPAVQDFYAHLARATLTDEMDAAGVRTVGYRNAESGSEGEVWLELRYDLVRNETVERRIDGRPFHPPALESPWAVQVDVGRTATLGEASLDAGGAPAVLFARDALTAPGLQEDRVWEALVLANGPQPVRLDTPVGTVRCAAFGFGAIRVVAPPGATSPSAVHVRCTGAGGPVVLPPAAAGPACTILVEGASWVTEG